ncbi:MAG TPA: TonB-dependent receptor plug domain-containing protein [Caulobacteraceae bacterium]|nr:TonB-dependent receptor plug domain-containing protein [Caulobacteraceae bacterium]
MAKPAGLRASLAFGVSMAVLAAASLAQAQAASPTVAAAPSAPPTPAPTIAAPAPGTAGPAAPPAPTGAPGAPSAQQAGRPAAAAATTGAATVGELVVTAQRKREEIQSVPIAISAFTGKTLEVQKIEGGPDLLKAVPNVTFTKTNFSGYNLTIRGIGTQAISVTTDPAVSINFNGTSIIRNRLFEQEFFDVERVEVLRGPQGTLYGRNATAGAVNVVSAKPTDRWGAEIKGEVGSYNTRRLSGYVNIPVIGDKLDLRIAGAWTKRDGFAFNSVTGHRIDGRDLYSTRVTVGFHPSPSIQGYLIWEHFDEDDNRARSTKQLCTHDSGPSSIGGVANLSPVARAFLSQGCADASLYSPNAYGTPNGLSIPFVLAGVQNTQTIGLDPVTGNAVSLLRPIDPWGDLMQPNDLRTIASKFDPVYRARNDLVEMNIDFKLGDNLTLTSETAWDHDTYFSEEDFNRFTTLPGIFNSTDGLINEFTLTGPAPAITPGGVYCDPQLGCGNTIEGIDRSDAISQQFSQEFRLASSWSGPFNFSVGANYTHYKTDEDYYVFFNVITALAQSFGPVGNYSANLAQCYAPSGTIATVTPTGNVGCVYIDPNGLNGVNGLGHNYFRSQNPVRIDSWGWFGEFYYKLRDDVKLTVGLRDTDDSKIFTPIPSQTLLNSFNGGVVDGGYPANAPIDQHWNAITGRFVIDWTPRLSFTDQTLVYLSYNHGYKAGGANPPPIGYSTAPAAPGFPPLVQLISYPQTFRPEYVDAFELGTKNTALGGRLLLNGDVFFYNYRDYQVSQIEDRTAINENFDAKVWGAELQAIFQVTRGLRLTGNFGYEGTSIARGTKSIDIENRTQGNPNFTILKPNEFLPSNCVVSVAYVASVIAANRAAGQPDDANLAAICPGTILSLSLTNPPTAADLPNGGRGFFADLSGHQLPNAPHWTQSISADYTLPLTAGWTATLHGDFYHQSASWARVYQDPIDRLRGWSNVNLSLIVDNSRGDLEFELYVKNLLNASPITGTFNNSDDTALVTNVFTLDPRVIGFSIRKRF